MKTLFNKRSLLIIFLFSCSAVLAQKSQNEELASMESASYFVYKPVEKSSNRFVFEKATKPWPVEFRKEGNYFTEILIKRAGIVDELYTVDLPAYPAYYNGGNKNFVVSVIDRKIFYYTWSSKSGATIEYILSNDSPGKYDDEKALLEEYRTTILSKQSGAREDRVEEKEELLAQEQLENTLEGKEIKSLKIKLVEASESLGLLSIVHIGIEVELADGKILKTKNLGGKTPYTDFDFIAKSGDFAGGDFKVASDSRKIVNDEIYLEAKSKFDNSPSAKFTLALNYKSDINYWFFGAGGAYGTANGWGNELGKDGQNAKDVIITADIETINGERVALITLVNGSTGELVAEAKLNLENTITINAKGGNGGTGCDGRHLKGDGTRGGNGGDGGNVMLSGSASQSLKIVVMNEGGIGGKGGSAENGYNSKGADGSHGAKGSFSKM